MIENPYEAPATLREDAAGPRSGRREDLRTVARCRTIVRVCILAHVYLILAWLEGPTDWAPMLASAYLLASPITLVIVALLVTKIDDGATGVVLGLLSVVPLLGLIVLMMVNGKAARVLREHVDRGGPPGADPSTD